MQNKKHRLIFFCAGILALASWIIALYYWDKLPAQIPTHFGINGLPDDWNNKSLFYVFFIPFLQTLMLAVFVFLYKNPQYSDMPTTLWLTTLAKEKKEHAFELIRTMLAVTIAFISILFSYMTYMMNASALKKDIGLNPWIMVTIMLGLISWLTYWTVKVYRETRKVIENK